MARPTNAEIAAREKPQSLEDYVTQAENAAHALDDVVVVVEHPLAVSGTIFNGRFSGVRVTKSDSPRAQMSSGKWLD